MHERPSLADDRPVRTTDPTGTGPLRKRLNRELDKRWRAVTRLMREAVDTSNILGVGAGPTLATVSLSTTGGGGTASHHPPLPGSDKVEGFHAFVTRVLQSVILGGNSAWIAPYLAEARRLAAEKAGRLGVPSSRVSTSVTGSSLAAAELGAIVARTATEATRVVAHEMGRARPQAAPIARAVAKVVKAGAGKSRLAADYLMSKEFTRATVDHYRAAGISKVGVEPERYAKRIRGKTVLMARDRAPRPVAEEDVVEVVTAGDDLVCFPAWTMVRTSRGDVPIQYVRVGDLVLTRSGFRRAAKTHRREWNGKLVRVEAGGRPAFICTSNHPIWTERGFVRADHIKLGECLQSVLQELVKVTRIDDLNLIDPEHRPASFYQCCVASVIAVLRFLVRMPIRTIHFERNVADYEVNRPAINTSFLNERNVEPRERRAHHAFNSRLAFEAAIARKGAKTPFQRFGWNNAEVGAALNTGHTRFWAAAFFRAEIAVKTARQVAARVFEWLTATCARFDDMARIGTLACHRTKIVAIGNSAFGHRELVSASNADFVYCVASARFIAIARAIQTITRNMIERATARCAAMITWKVLSFRRHCLVYNITVEGCPEYYVNGFLVHNCEECQNIANGGPYDLDEAMDLIPAHPRCRCSLLPAEDAGFGAALGALGDAALGLGAGQLLGALLPGEEEEEPEAAPEAAEEEEPEDDFPGAFFGTTAGEYIAYVQQWLEWADANDWPSDLIQQKWDEESVIREALQVPLTPEQADDLLRQVEAAGSD